MTEAIILALIANIALVLVQFIKSHTDAKKTQDLARGAQHEASEARSEATQAKDHAADAAHSVNNRPTTLRADMETYHNEVMTAVQTLQADVKILHNSDAAQWNAINSRRANE